MRARRMGGSVVAGLAILVCAWARAEEKGLVESNLSYYAESEIKGDEYKRQRCLLDVYHPASIGCLPVVVWFHGGGLTSGSKYIPKPLRDQNLVVVAANYRLSPKASGTNCIEDAAKAVAWTFHNVQRYGGDTNRIYVSGHSAGAYLTLMVGLDKRWLDRDGLDADRLAGLAPLSGQAITHFTIRKERGQSDKLAVIDEWAPLYHARSNAPPVLLVTGDRQKDMPTRYEENAYLAQMMKLNGHTNTTLYELQGFGHGSMHDPAFPLVLEFIRATSPDRK